MACAIEVLEHVPEPEATLAEMARVALAPPARVSVPREPLWRGLNMARGAYLRDARQHPRPREPLVQAGVRRAAVALRDGRGGALAVPLDHGACPRRLRPPSATAAAPRSSRSGSASPALVTFALLRARQPLADRGRVRAHHAAVVGGVHHGVGALPAGRAAAVAHDRRPRRARRDRHASTCAWRRRSSSALGVLFVVVALALRGPIEDDLLGGSGALYWILIVAVLAYAASYFARGFLAGHHRFGLYGGLVLMEASSRCLFALAVAVGIAEGQTAVALGIAAAPIVSLAVVPWALGRRLRAQPPVDEPTRSTPSRDEPAASRVHARPRQRLRRRRAADHAQRADLPQRRARCSSRRPRARAARRSPASPSTCC